MASLRCDRLHQKTGAQCVLPLSHDGLHDWGKEPLMRWYQWSLMPFLLVGAVGLFALAVFFMLAVAGMEP